MTFYAVGHAKVDLGPIESAPHVSLVLRIPNALGLESVAGVQLDENHATALALALQAAVAEIQARAVSR